jgi:hypothetical protein
MPETPRPIRVPKQLRFTVGFDKKPETEVEVVAYAFERGGRLLASAPVKAGQVELPLLEAVAAGRGVRLLLAPPFAPEGEKREPTPADLEQMHAYEPAFKADPKKQAYELLPIPYEIWKWWLKCKCRVRGKVVKPVVINGFVVDKPVCEARVHICEVDMLWVMIPKLPDPLIVRLRDDLIRELQKPPHIPDPDPEGFHWPPPLPDPPRLFPRPEPAADISTQSNLPGTVGRATWGAFDPQPEPPGKLFRIEGWVGLNPQPEPPVPPDWWRQRIGMMGLNPASSLIGKVALNPQPLPPKTTMEQLPAAVQSALLSPSLVQVRKALVENAKLIQPYLCLWPWLHPYICHCDEVAVVESGDGGIFDTVITYPCFGDKPDLYFWVEYLIDGVWTTVYRPWRICCYTYWDYACGSEVTIHVTDPRVPTCEEVPDLPGLMVTVTTIGNGVSMSEIQKASDAKPGFTTAGEPFAGTLELRMDLSRTNLIAKGIKYYRWSYRRLTQGDATTAVSDTPHPMTYPVNRFYKTLVPNPTPPPVMKPYYPTDQMGPDSAFPGQYLFRIQPANPPAPGIEWSVLNEHVDLAHAYFQTGDLYESDGVTPAAGKYELTLELFKSDGSLVNWSHPTGAPGEPPIDAFMSSNAAPFMPPVGMTTVPAPSENLVKMGGDVWGFKMVLYVDNTRCEAEIYDTWADIITKKAGPCGFIRFDHRGTSQAHLSFKARQAFDHAWFRFRVDKGSSGDVQEACADWDAVSHAASFAPVGSLVVNGFGRDPSSVFSKAVGVATLLDANGFNCNEAAFAETLDVHAIATDGYQRAWWLDADGIPKAFALSPTP